MLSLMRKHAQSWLIKVTLGAIIVVFIFWYGYSYREGRADQIATVDDSPISIEEFRSVYDRMLESYRRQFGDRLDDKLIQSLNLKKQALDEIINRRLLLQEAGQLDFRVLDNELLAVIQQQPAFQRNGRFDPRVYERVLMSNRLTPEIFEEGQKQELLIEKVRGFYLSGLKVSEGEAMETYNWQNEEVSLEYVVFEPDEYGDVSVSEEEMQAYFSEHKHAYEIPPMVKVEYVHFDFKAFEAAATVSEEDINTYFDLNKEDFATPKKVKARHILFEVKPGAEPEVIEKVEKKALGVLAQAKSGKDFGELAKKYSDDPGSRDKGGDLGFFTRDRMVEPFADAAFSMKPGEISDLVRTPFGFHIIKVEQIQEAKEPELADVSDEIRAKLARDAGKSAAFDRAEEIYEACYEAGSVSEVARTNQLSLHETEFFSEKGPVKGIKESKKFAQTAFALAEEGVSEPLELSDGYYILQPVAKKPATIPALESVKEMVREDLIRAKKKNSAKKSAESFFDVSKEEGSFQEAAAKRDLKTNTTDFFGRSEAIPEIGFEPEILEAAFLLSASKPFPDSVLKGKKGYYVIHFKGRQQADPNEFEDKKSEIMSNLLNQKRRNALKELLDRLRAKSEISIEEGFLD
jgi:peptidyl-prolyl cis-trans isomerase D